MADEGGRRVRSGFLTRCRVVWAALKFRARPSAALFVLAVGAAVAAAVGPIYLSAADGSVLRTALSGAPDYTTGLSLTPAPGQESRALADLRLAVAALPRGAGGISYYAAPVVTATEGGGMGDFVATLTARTEACAQLTIVSGSCPSGTGSVLLSTRSAQAIGARTGGTVQMSVGGTKMMVTLTVAGTYLPGNPNAPYWWGVNPFVFDEAVPHAAAPVPPPLDAVFTTEATVLAVGGLRASLEDQLALRLTSLTPGDVASFQSGLAAFTQLATGKVHVQATTGVAALLSQAASQQGRMTSVVTVAALELVLLALLVLYAVAARTSETREPELALAALRGLSVRASVSWALLEPAVLLVAAMPAGLLVAWGGMAVVAPHLLPAGSSPAPTATAIGAVLLTLAAAGATLAAASRRLLRPTLAGDLRVGLAGPRRARANALEGITLGLAVAALVELSSVGVSGSGKTNAVAAFAPALVAIAVGLVGRRLLPALGALGVRATEYSRRVATFLALRNIARRAAAWRQLVELTVAVSLLAFAVSAWFAASNDRAVQAGFVTGAQSVVTVKTVPPLTLEAAVRQAEPTGRLAMAVVQDATADQLLLAVDSSRFPHVASWPSDISQVAAAQVPALLHPSAAPPLYFYGRAARVTVSTLTTPVDAPDLTVGIFDVATQSSTTLDLGRLTPGAHEYTASFGALCGSGCRITGIGPLWPSAAVNSGRTLSLSLSITSLADEAADGRWRVVPAPLDESASWRGTSATVTPSDSGTSGALRCRFVLAGGGGVPPTVAPADTPVVLPAIVTDAFTANDSGSVPGGQLPIEGLDGAALDARWAGTASALPGIGSSAALVDLSYLALLQDSPQLDTTDQVWVAGVPSPALLHRLGQAGLDVLQVSLASSVGAGESHGSDALADLFLLVAGGLAVLLAAGTSLVLLLTEGRQRGAAVAALMATHVPRAAVRRSLSIEQLMVLSAGTLLGAVAGGVAAWLALPSVPVVAQLPGGPPLTFPLPVLPLLVAVAGVLVMLVATMAVGVQAAMRAGGTAALRVKPR